MRSRRALCTPFLFSDKKYNGNRNLLYKNNSSIFVSFFFFWTYFCIYMFYKINKLIHHQNFIIIFLLSRFTRNKVIFYLPHNNKIKSTKRTNSKEQLTLSQKYITSRKNHSKKITSLFFFSTQDSNPNKLFQIYRLLIVLHFPQITYKIDIE